MSRLGRNLCAGLAAGSLVLGIACTPQGGPPPGTTAKSDATPAAPEPKEVSDDAPPVFAPPEDVKALAEGNNAFAIDLYKQLAAKTDGNLFFSPYCVRTALAMTYAGARGQTAEEMAKVLHFTLPPERLHPAFGATAYQLQERGKKLPLPVEPGTPKGKKFETRPDPFRLTIANALWGQRGFAFVPDFLDLTKKNYAGGFREVDFASDTEGSRQTINRWVAQKTQDKFKELLNPNDVTPNTRLVLANAIYFRAAWLTPFLKGQTCNAMFEVSPNEKITVAMMQTQEADFWYLKTHDAEWVALRYGNGVSMIVCLPRNGQLVTVEQWLTSSIIKKTIGKLSKHIGKVLLPKFQVHKRELLNGELSNLGMSRALSDEADFSGMTSGGGLRISRVIHEAHVNVDEWGTEAAAATGVIMDLNLPPPFSFTADRPFLFFIRDNETRTILFSGRIARPDIVP